MASTKPHDPAEPAPPPDPVRGYGIGLEAVAVVDRTRLQLPEDLNLQAWCRIGTRLVTVCDSSAWWIGDWLVFGHDRYPDRYRRAMTETTLDYQTLRNYAWVARAFVPSRRRDTLTFQHHMEVAALPEVEQDHWLDFAVRLKWSRNELRRHVKANARRAGRRGPARNVSLQLEPSREQYQRWLEAAEREQTDLQEWIVGELDRAVRAVDPDDRTGAALPATGSGHR